VATRKCEWMYEWPKGELDGGEIGLGVERLQPHACGSKRRRKRAEGLLTRFKWSEIMLGAEMQKSGSVKGQRKSLMETEKEV
jgi:hypothetical protein